LYTHLVLRKGKFFLSRDYTKSDQNYQSSTSMRGKKRKRIVSEKREPPLMIQSEKGERRGHKRVREKEEGHQLTNREAVREEKGGKRFQSLRGGKP